MSEGAKRYRVCKCFGEACDCITFLEEAHPADQDVVYMESDYLSLQAELAKYKLQWTSEVPTEAKPYWWKDNHGDVGVIEFRSTGKYLRSIGDNVKAEAYIRFGHQFAGPIQLPEEE